jgi:hypothetical protein
VAHVTGGGDVLGGGAAGDSFAAAVARQRRAEAARQQRRNDPQGDLKERAQAYAQAEEAKMAHFRALIGGGPLSIPKRA